MTPKVLAHQLRFRQASLPAEVQVGKLIVFAQIFCDSRHAEVAHVVLHEVKLLQATVHLTATTTRRFTRIQNNKCECKVQLMSSATFKKKVNEVY